MNVSGDIQSLLANILHEQCTRADLALWLAKFSWRFLESPNEAERAVVADLDAALGEIQAGRAEETLLFETARQLVVSLGLEAPGAIPVASRYGSSLQMITGTSNQGGAAIQYLVPVQSPS